MILNKKLVLLFLLLSIIFIILDRNLLMNSGIQYLFIGISISALLFIISSSNYITNRIKIHVGADNSTLQFTTISRNDIINYIENIDRSNKNCVYYAKSFLTLDSIQSYVSKRYNSLYTKDAVNYIIDCAIDNGDISFFCGVISRNTDPSKDISDYLIYKMFLDNTIMKLPTRNEFSSQILFLYPYNIKTFKAYNLPECKSAIIIKAVTPRKMGELIRNAKLPVKNNAVLLGLLVSGLYVIK